MPQASPNALRADFAQRLKDWRSARGFKTARAFALALGIDENRYTRYERHEVEPDLSLLVRMSTALGVTPNDLLGFPSPLAAAPSTGFAEDATSTDGAGARASARSLAWQLACSLSQLPSGDEAEVDPRDKLRRTAELFAEIDVDPFGFATRAAELPAFAALAPERQCEAVAAMNEMLTRLGGAAR